VDSFLQVDEGLRMGAGEGGKPPTLWMFGKKSKLKKKNVYRKLKSVLINVPLP
jgi:hypothetical protein